MMISPSSVNVSLSHSLPLRIRFLTMASFSIFRASLLTVGFFSMDFFTFPIVLITSEPNGCGIVLSYYCWSLWVELMYGNFLFYNSLFWYLTPVLLIFGLSATYGSTTHHLHLIYSIFFIIQVSPKPPRLQAKCSFRAAEWRTAYRCWNVILGAVALAEGSMVIGDCHGHGGLKKRRLHLWSTLSMLTGVSIPLLAFSITSYWRAALH